MYNYTPRRQFGAPTVLGLDERIERVLCYALGWVSGLLFLFIETRNQTVRAHARQSVLVFGSLGLLGIVVSFFGGLLSHIWLIGGLFALGFGLLGWLIGAVVFGLWILLMALAFFSPEVFVGRRFRGML